jgi:hypothetical protein
MLPSSLSPFFLSVLVGLCITASAGAEINNLRIVTDASPDYTDMDGLIHSVTSKWTTPEEKCWAMYFWNHIARRQTNPMMLHGFAVTDPIRQFNDYGFTMCSTISGMNCAIWDAMGMKAKYWDVTLHTVAEVEYGGRWHMYDNSLSALYTLCDGKTIAGVEDIGKKGACEASGGKEEPGHIAKYHCLHATSKGGFLTGADTMRSLEDEVKVFNPNGLKYRSYYYDWDRGHRYILNLRQDEVHTRHYSSLGDLPGLYVPNGGKDPEKKSNFKIRGNGERIFKPALTADALPKLAHSLAGLKAVAPAGVEVAQTGGTGEVVFKVEGANVITSIGMKAAFWRGSQGDVTKIAISTTNGLGWTDVWTSDATGDVPAELTLVEEVNGSYEVLVKISLSGRSKLQNITFDTKTQINAKTQPKLNIGKNTIHVGAGDQTQSIVFWPELQGGKAKPFIVEQHNIVFEDKNPGYMGTLHAEKANEEAWVVFRMDAPRDVTRVNYGGRFYNRARNSHIDLLHSFDEGKSWTKSYSLTDTAQPWDVIHYDTVDKVPSGTRSVLFKYLLNSSEAGSGACSIFAVRMEANHLTADPVFHPMEVAFTWNEKQADRSLVERSHTELITKLPWKYEINVGGVDHPIMKALRVNFKGAAGDTKYGYSDGKNAGGEKFVPRWMTIGQNLAEGKPYTLSHPSETTWESGDPEGRKLTDGVAGPSFAGGTSYRYGALWKDKKNPVITVDLGKSATCASFGLNLHGYPWHDALNGEIKDTVEVLVSNDGKDFTSVGFLKTDLLRRDVPVNFMVPDNEELTGGTFRCIPEKPVPARYVQFKVTNKRVFVATEIEVLDTIRFEPFDLRIALPEKTAATAATASAK